MRSEDQSWVMLFDPRFTVLELTSRRGRYHIQYFDVVTGWGGNVARFQSRADTAASDEGVAPGDRSQRVAEAGAVLSGASARRW